MSVKKVFIAGRLIKPAVDIIKNAGCEIILFKDETRLLPTENEAIDLIKGCHGIFTFGPLRINSKILDAAGDQLKVVSTMSVGVDSVDVAELKKRGIRLGHTPGVLDDAVADITIGLLLATSRRIVERAEDIRSGRCKWDPFGKMGVGLKNSTVGIVGFGRIGIAVAKRLVPFGISKIIYNSRSQKPDAEKEVNATYISFDELLQESDFVICCCSMNKSSKELFNKSAFSKMKSNAIFVNIGRGGLVDQDALIHALENNLIQGAGLDVTTPEPLPKEHKLFTFPNVCITPHIASYEVQTRTDMATLAARNLVAALNDEKMPAEYPL